jgi:hypothetical protein
MIIPAEKSADRIRLIAIEDMKGAFGNEGALRFYNSIGIARSTTDGNFRPQKA